MKRIIKNCISICLSVCILGITGCEKIGSGKKKSYTTAPDVIYDGTQMSPEAAEFAESVCVIGDSIGVGYGAYGRIPTEHCCAQKGISLSQARDNVFEVEGLGDYTAAEFTEYMQPEYLMVILGMNDITCGDPQGFAENYMDFVSELHDISPDSRIFVMSISPVEYDMETISNQMIDEYNYALSEVFDDCSFAEFTDAAEVLRTEDGYMDEEVSAGDGIHLNEAAYDRLLGQMQSYI